MELPFSESYRIKTTEALKRSTKEERVAWIKEAKYNLFKLKSDAVFIDMLTDSGTGAMSDRQWAAIMTGDESYAGARSFHELKDTVERLMGFKYFLPTHQGRAAENVLFSVLVKDGNIVPGNSHFDTTKGHIEFRNATAVDCTIDEAFDTTIDHPFKGNLDLGKLEKIYKEYPKEQIPCCIVTVTCNSSGGQPVSIQNMNDVYALSKKYGIPVLYDSARFAENAYFIKLREEAYKDWTIKEIVAEMYKYADYATMSAKKDGIVNIGGFIGFKDEETYRQACTFSILFEGYVTYGGMSGRDMAALAVGLDENTEFDYLETRVKQVEYLGKKLMDYGVPIQYPIGGHAIFVDANKILSNVPKEQFRAQTLGIELYLEGGIRGVEIGTLLADRDPVTRENRYPKLELLRLAVARRVYTDNHMDYIAAALKNVYDRRNKITSGFNITWEAPIMRHFTIELDKA